MTPLMLAMGRRRAEVEAVAGGRDGGSEVAGEAVGLARGRMGRPIQAASLTAVTAQAAGELSCLFSPIPLSR